MARMVTRPLASLVTTSGATGGGGPWSPVKAGILNSAVPAVGSTLRGTRLGGSAGVASPTAVMRRVPNSS